MNGNCEQLVPEPVSKRWKARWQHEPVHHNVNAHPVQNPRPDRMNRQKFDPPAGQVKNRYDHKRHEEMERQTEPSRNQPAVVRVGTQQSSGDSLQSAPQCHTALPPDYERGRNIQNTDEQTGGEDRAKRSGILHMLSGAYSGKQKIKKQRNNRSDNRPVDANLCKSAKSVDN